MKEKTSIFNILILVLLCSTMAKGAVESASTLPRGVYSPEFVYGIVDGLGERFDAGGTLIKVTDPYHMDLTGPNIAKLSSRGALLVNTLNSLSAEKIGDKLVFPSVDFKANPSINYFVVNPAYGVKENLAVGFGFPVIHFKNQMEIVSSGFSNIDDIRSYTQNLNPQLDAGLSEAKAMAANINATVQDMIRTKGYKPIGLVEYTTIGDTQVYARYRYLDNEHLQFAIRPYLLLPTGRDDDPDDLGDFAVGGLMGIGTYLTQEFYTGTPFRFSLIFQYQAHIPDRVERRVPGSDVLPGIERKELVSRQTGNLFDATVASRYHFGRMADLGAFYGFTTKDPDWFDGSRGYNYSVLSQDSGYQTHKLGAFLEFSSTDLYFEKKMPIPLILGYTFSTVVSAVNSPHQTTHILNMRMFF